jgi:chromosomal replication initiator protein
LAQPSALWTRVLEYIKGQIPGEAYETWLAPTRGSELQDDVLIVEVPNPFFIDWIGQYYGSTVEEAVRTVLGEKTRVAFRNGTGGEQTVVAQAKKRPLPASENTRLQERYTFQNMIVADCNRFAVAAAKAVADAPGSKYNPLLIYGGVGLGKTHLVQAIGNQLNKTRHGFRVYYTPAEALFIELIAAIERGSTMDFKHKYRSQDLLLIDDVHYLVGKERLQEEVFHIFNHLHGQGKQVVFTSDRPVKEIPTLEERLSSRLISGLVVDLQSPDLETRVAILKRKAESENFELPQDVALYIATQIKTNVRQLEGCLIRLIALASMDGHVLTRDLAAKALRDLIPRHQQISRELIIERVCETFGVSASDLRGKTRTRRITNARQVAMYLYRNLLELSLKETGALLGGRDHTTVMHSIGKVDAQRQSDQEFNEKISQLIAGFGN